MLASNLLAHPHACFAHYSSHLWPLGSRLQYGVTFIQDYSLMLRYGIKDVKDLPKRGEIQVWGGRFEMPKQQSLSVF